MAELSALWFICPARPGGIAMVSYNCEPIEPRYCTQPRLLEVSAIRIESSRVCHLTGPRCPFGPTAVEGWL